MTGTDKGRWGIVGGHAQGRRVLFVTDMERSRASLCYVLLKPVETLSETECLYWALPHETLRRDIGADEIHFVMEDVFDWRSMSIAELLSNARITP